MRQGRGGVKFVSFISVKAGGNFVVEIKTLTMSQKVLNYKHVRLLAERKDEKGAPIPFDFTYIALSGEVIEGKNVVCISVDPKTKTRRLKFLDSGQVRKIHDVLLTSINDTRIIVR